MLGQNELIRYDRQILIKELGEFGQEKLKQSKVFIAGAGGLGCLVSIYLVAAGIGRLAAALGWQSHALLHLPFHMPL